MVFGLARPNTFTSIEALGLTTVTHRLLVDPTVAKSHHAFRLQLGQPCNEGQGHTMATSHLIGMVPHLLFNIRLIQIASKELLTSPQRHKAPAKQERICCTSFKSDANGGMRSSRSMITARRFGARLAT